MLRHLAGEARGFADEQPFQPRQAVDDPEPDVAEQPQHVGAVGEQPVEPVGRDPHRHGVEAPPALVALEHVGAADVEAEARRIDHALGQRRDVAQAHVEPLPGDRVDHVRGVADQREPLGDEGARDEQAERIGAPWPDHLDVAQMKPEAPLELGVKVGIRQRDDALRLVVLLGPHDRRAPSLQRQDRERAGGQKMLLGAAAMIALMGDGGDDRGLIVGPAERLDAGALAQRRARAVGGDEQARRDPLAVGEPGNDNPIASRGGISKSAIATGRKRYAFGPRLGGKRVGQRRVLDHVGERFARLDLAVEGEKRRPHHVVEAAVGHHHVEDRLRLRRRPPPTRRWSRTGAAPPPRSRTRADRPWHPPRTPDRRP